MNLQKYTQKSIDAINNAKNLAEENGNQQLTQEHLLLSLLEQDNGLIGTLITRMGADAAQLKTRLINAVAALPQVSGGEIYLSPEASRARARMSK